MSIVGDCKCEQPGPAGMRGSVTMSKEKSPPMPERLRYDGHGCMIFDEQCGVGGDELVADLPPFGGEGGELARVRGWGRLTGRGGLNLSDEEAVRYQDRVGRRLVMCWNICSVVGLTDEELESLSAAPREVLRAMLIKGKA